MGESNAGAEALAIQADGKILVGGYSMFTDVNAFSAFTVLRFPYQELSDVVYIEHLTSALYLDRREDVDRYTAAIGRLFIEAAPPGETPAILNRVIAEIDRGNRDDGGELGNRSDGGNRDDGGGSERGNRSDGGNRGDR